MLVIANLSAEEIELPELRNLFEADLIVDASFKSQGREYFYITINEVIKDPGFGIQKGDQINLPKVDDGCGFVIDFSYYKRQRYYLKKLPNEWILNYGSIQSVQSVYQFGDLSADDRFCGFSSVGPAANPTVTMNETIRGFLKTYRYDKDEQVYVPLVDSVALLSLAKNNVMIARFENNNRRSLNSDVEVFIEEEPILPKSIETLEKVPCEIAHKKGKPSMDEQELRAFLYENENPMADAGIEGKVILQLTINDSGRVEDVEVLRGIHPKLDSLATQKALSMAPWEVAEDSQGRKRTCFTNLPFRFQATNE